MFADRRARSDAPYRAGLRRAVSRNFTSTLLPAHPEVCGVKPLPISRPCGTWSTHNRVPALKRRAIFSGPFGTKSGTAGKRSVGFPGRTRKNSPNGVYPCLPVSTPIGVEEGFRACPRVAPATLGFGLESRWDCLRHAWTIVGRPCGAKTGTACAICSVRWTRAGCLRTPITEKTTGEAANQDRRTAAKKRKRHIKDRRFCASCAFSRQFLCMASRCFNSHSSHSVRPLLRHSAYSAGQSPS